jgi:hypothetical protein
LWRRACRVCEGCPCRVECAVEALSHGAVCDGVWAGVRLSQRLSGARIRVLLESVASGTVTVAAGVGERGLEHDEPLSGRRVVVEHLVDVADGVPGGGG